MKKLFIKQKVFSIGGKFTVKNELEEDLYFVEGSFMQIPKTFTIMNMKRNEVGIIRKKVFSWLPTFYLDVAGKEVLTIKKEFTFFKSRYSIDAMGIEVRGNWWDMDFELLQHGEVIGQVNKKWFTWGDSYQVKIYNEDLEAIITSIVIAISCAKADQTATNAAAIH